MVRLKGGCPSVFSRCSSEIAALSQAGITTELVPGVSSVLAAPLLAGEHSLHENQCTEMQWAALLTTLTYNLQFGSELTRFLHSHAAD